MRLGVRPMHRHRRRPGARGRRHDLGGRDGRRGQPAPPPVRGPDPPPGARVGGAASAERPGIGGLLVGLPLGNHLLTLFIAPFVALFVLWAGRRELLARPAGPPGRRSPGSSPACRSTLHPDRGQLQAGAAVQRPGHARPRLVARHRRAVPGPVRLPSAGGPAEFLRSLPDLWDWCCRAGDRRSCPCSGSPGSRSSSSGDRPSR